MNGRSRDQSNATEPPNADSLLRWALGILTAYLVVMLIPMVAWTRISGSSAGLLLHVTALGVVSLACAATLPTSARHWTPLALGPLLYVELRWLIIGAARAHQDVLVAGWEHIAFPTDPSRNLAQTWPSAPLSELLHAAYLSYYALIFVPPALLWLRGRRSAFSSTLLALTVVYALCFTIYVVFPVDGPRFLHGPANAPNGPVRALVVALLESGSSRGTAFPSSHVAASLVASVCALRFQRPLGVVIGLLTAGVSLGAVYGGYHYAIDIVAGLVTGAVALAIALMLEDRVTSVPGVPHHPRRH